jgi:hypothetical protein
MKRPVLLIMVLTLVLAAAACGPMEYNDERDRAQVVAEVNGVSILKGAFNDRLNSIQPFFEQTLTGQTEEEAGQAVALKKEQVLETLIDEEIRRQLTAEYGLGLTEDELAEINRAYDASIDSMMKFLGAQYGSAGVEKTEEELREAAVAEFEAQGVTKEKFIENGTEKVLLKKLEGVLQAEAGEMSDGELEAYYQSILVSQQQEYAVNPSRFENAMEKGETVVFIPAGYRRIKRLFIGYSDIECGMIKELKGYDKPEALEDTIATAYRNIAGKVEEVAARIEADDTTFDELIGIYSDGEQPEGGYYVCSSTSRLDGSMVEAAMALGSPGEISGPVREDLGASFLMYVGDVEPAGAVAFDEVRGSLLDGAYEARLEKLMSQKIEDRKRQSDIKRHTGRL